MNRPVVDGSLSAETFEALSPARQLAALLDMVERYIDGSPGHSIDPWHAAKIRHALLKIDAGEVEAAAHDLALADQPRHGDAELVLEDVSVETLRKEVSAARRNLPAVR
jgi:hypothetical protein